MKLISQYIIIPFLAVNIALLSVACTRVEKDRSVRIMATTDIHGNIFSKDLVSGDHLRSSVSKVSSFIRSCDSLGLVILDNGDNLQGNPSVYYYNFEDTTSHHLWAEVLNYLDYDAITVGNHDLEAGHKVYDRIRSQYNFPMLAANGVSVETGEPYFEPYTIIRKNGLKIAVLGLITPGVPGWLPEVLYSGIEFEDMTKSAEKWMPEIKKQNPDIIVGLFHSGWNQEYGGGIPGSLMNENASLEVAEKVPGFDVVFIGHDHDVKSEYVINSAGDTVLILDGGSHARFISVADLSVTGSGKNSRVKASGFLVKTDTLVSDPLFDEQFRVQFGDVRSYVKRNIGSLNNTISTRESYFGDSPFMDLIHKVQLETTGADISFAAPLSFDVTIDSGDILVQDMFDLYRYENMLYTISLSGNEIDSYLEYSYGLWTNQMNSITDYMLKYNPSDKNLRFSNRYYNFDSAEGIIYEVDLTRNEGDRVSIKSMTSGEPFITDKMYRVALNSYRGSGGGGHLTSGSGLGEKEIKSRLINSSDKDLRYYMIKWFEKEHDINIETNGNWKFVPGNWTDSAGKREYKLLFTELL